MKQCKTVDGIKVIKTTTKKKMSKDQWVYVTAVTIKVDPPVPGYRTRGPEKSSEDLFVIKIVLSSLIHTHTQTFDIL